MVFEGSSAAISHTGKVRSNNQDSGYSGSNLFVVADGMGGHAGGDVDRSIAVHRIWCFADHNSRISRAPGRLSSYVDASYAPCRRAGCQYRGVSPCSCTLICTREYCYSRHRGVAATTVRNSHGCQVPCGVDSRGNSGAASDTDNLSANVTTASC